MKSVKVLGTLIIASFFVVSCGSESGENKAASFREISPEILTIEKTVEAVGLIYPYREIKVGTEVSGEVVSVPVDFNASVKIGDTLAVIDPSGLSSVIEQIRSQIREAKSNIELQELQIKRSRLNLRASEALAEREADLFAENATSATLLEETRKAYELASLDLNLAEVTLETKQAALERLRSQMAAAQVDLAKSTISSPVDGLILRRKVEVGQTVQARFNSPELFVVGERRSPVVMTAYVSENDIWDVQVSNSVRVRPTSNPLMQLSGRISEIRLTPEIENGLTRYPVIVELDHRDLRLLPGMNASAQIVIKSATTNPTVPLDALIFEPFMAERHPQSDEIIARGLQELMIGNLRAKLSSLKISDDVANEIVSNVTRRTLSIFQKVAQGLTDRQRSEFQSDIGQLIQSVIEESAGADVLRQYSLISDAQSLTRHGVVWIRSDGYLLPLPVALGVFGDRYVEIVRGASLDDKIIVERLSR